MSIEIERKFLVHSDAWRTAAGPRRHYRQGYLARTPQVSVRVRRADDHAVITIKGPRAGCARQEFEYRIPLSDAEAMLGLCATPEIEKVRRRVEHAGMTWVVDVYRGEAEGLVLAEVELARIDQAFALPPWVGPEVTHDPRYHSAAIEQGLWRHADAPSSVRRSG